MRRSIPGLHLRRVEDEASMDPDNTPPRSRLFMVVPKNADGSIIEAEMSRFSSMQYCKTDLIASKGIVFVKYATSSSACVAMETIQSTGAVAGYKVKIMLAEPKSRRNDSKGLLQSQFIQPNLVGTRSSTNLQQTPLSMGISSDVSGLGQLHSQSSALSGTHGLSLQDFAHPHANMHTANSLPNLRNGTLLQDESMNQLSALPGSLGNASVSVSGPLGSDYLGAGGFAGLGLHQHALGGLNGESLLGRSPMLPPLDGQSIQIGLQKSSGRNSDSGPEGPPNTRLFIVVPRSVTEEVLSQLFQCYPGMEYLDLKRDSATGRSKGFAFVAYSTLEAASAARTNLDGIEFPFGSGYRIKVRYAESLDVSRSRAVNGDTSGGKGGALSSSTTGMLGTSSNDTAMTAFQIPSPSSGDSVGQNHSSPRLAQNLRQSLLSNPHTATSQLPRGGADTSIPHEGLLSPQTSPLPLRENGLSIVDSASHTPVNVAAMQAGLGNLSLGTSITSGHTNPERVHTGSSSAPQSYTSPASAGQASAVQSDSGDQTGSWREGSPDLLATATSAQLSSKQASGTSNHSLTPISSPNPPMVDKTVVYSNLTRALPDYASLSSVFQSCGSLEYVHVLSREGFAMIKFASAEAAENAVEKLDGAELLGEVLQVRATPPVRRASANDGLGSLGGSIGSWS